MFSLFVFYGVFGCGFSFTIVHEVMLFFVDCGNEFMFSFVVFSLIDRFGVILWIAARNCSNFMLTVKSKGE